MPNPEQQLDKVIEGYEALSPDVRERWAMEQVQTIRNTVAKDLTVPEFQMGMAMAAKYDLDPLAHEIWFVKGRAQDGGPGRPMIMAGRDGFLKIARNTKGWKGMDSDVVRENDTFEVSRGGVLPTLTGGMVERERRVVHSYSGSDVERGAIRGAWAIAYFEGKVPFYYYAPMAEYKPRNEAKLRHSPWGTQESVMILKCAQAYVLRIAVGISGIVSVEESERAFEGQQLDAQSQDLAEVAAATLASATPDVHPELRDRLYAALMVAQKMRPGYVTPASVQMSLSLASREQVELFIARLEHDNEMIHNTDPEDAEVVTQDAE